ncbi:MAG: transposase [Parasporobacterium sp.]|nr:transposase [Parasporobacterium sp.]
MYLDFKVDIPVVKGKITYRNKAGTQYVYYEYDRIYDKNTQKTNPKRVTIGKKDPEDPSKMIPNRNFLQYFPDAELPEEKDRTTRSSCLRVGAWMVIRKIIRDYGLEEILSGYMGEKDLGLFLDLTAYTIITEDNAAQYYPDYAYNHPLLTPDMKIYSDSTVSRLLSSMTDDQSDGFVNEWNEGRSRREKIYISYDATNKNCQAGDVDIVEFGHAKVDMGLPVFNYTVAYDRNNEEPLFYEKYSGSLTDTVQLKYMLEKVEGYGYKHVGFILDRGYFSRSNIRFMDEHHYSFVIMVKGMKALVNELILSKKGSFENKWAKYIEDYDVYGTTVPAKLYEGDEKTRYFHIYHNTLKEGAERAAIAKNIRRMKEFAKKQVNREYEFGSAYSHYFRIHYNDKNKQFQFLEDRTDVIEWENSLCGYFCIITSEKMSAKEALLLYKSRDTSEKLFRGDKSYLGDKSERVYSNESVAAKIFVEFVALIIRNRIYTSLKEGERTLSDKPNYMTVPAAIKELEKIEMTRQTDNIYRLDHGVTKKQKRILQAFGIDVPLVTYWAKEISEQLKEVSRRSRKGSDSK